MCHFRYPPKRPKWVFLAILGGTENGTWGAQIKILRPLLNTNTPLKPHLDTLGANLDPRKANFGHFIDFGHFSIEIPIEAENGKWKEVSYSKNKNCFGICE